VLTLKKFTKTGKKIEDRVKYPLELNFCNNCFNCQLSYTVNPKKLFQEYNNNVKVNKNFQKISIFVGSTGAIGEALEYGCTVIHIVENSILQTYNNELYPSIKIKVISKNIFQYSLVHYGSLIKFGKKIITFKKYLNA
jgi:hypothetical protein